MKDTKIKFKNFIEYFIVCIGVFILRAFTLQGPVYDLCAEDNSIFFIIGREILNGKVLYRDITDQKGVYTFLIYALAALISKTSQIGMYLIFTSLMCIVIGYLYNTLRMKMGLLESIASAYFIVLMLCWTPVMTFNGYNEDFILLCYLTSMIALYRHFDERYSNYKMMLLHGILCGIILNMKPNYIIFYIPIAIHLLITTLKDKHYIELKNNIISGLCGILLANIPMLVYTISNNCFMDMIHELYGNNGFDVYGQYNLKEMIPFVIIHLSLLLVIMIASIIVIRVHRKEMTLLYISLNIMALTGALMSGRPYVHYTEVLMVFCVPIIVCIIKSLFKLRIKIAPIIVCLSFAYMMTTYQKIYTDALYDLYITDDANYGIYKVAKLYRDKYSEYENLVYIGYGGLLYYNTEVPVDKHPSLPCIPFEKYTDAIYYKEDEIRNNNPDMIIIQMGHFNLIGGKLSEDVLDILRNDYTEVTDYLDEYNIHYSHFYLRNDLLLED